MHYKYEDIKIKQNMFHFVRIGKYKTHHSFLPDGNKVEKRDGIKTKDVSSKSPLIWLWCLNWGLNRICFLKKI